VTQDDIIAGTVNEVEFDDAKSVASNESVLSVTQGDVKKGLTAGFYGGAYEDRMQMLAMLDFNTEAGRLVAYNLMGNKLNEGHTAFEPGEGDGYTGDTERIGNNTSVLGLTQADPLLDGANNSRHSV